jgi:restriction system protein
MSRKKDIRSDIYELIVKIVVLYISYLFILWFLNKQAFWKGFFIGLSVVLIFSLVVFLIRKFIKKRKENLMEDISSLGLNNYINNFINISGKERGRGSWKYMNYSFNYDTMKIFIKTLKEKELNVKNTDDLEDILKKLIDDKEEALIRGGFELNQYKFSSLSGIAFENLLIRLYQEMEYVVEHPGGSGDQGADLILNKGGQRILVQAKCYKNIGIGNSAVQEAVAAKTHYACNIAMVVGVPFFTKGAQVLARTNGVELIDKKELQELLLKHLKESWN